MRSPRHPYGTKGDFSFLAYGTQMQFAPPRKMNPPGGICAQKCAPVTRVMPDTAVRVIISTITYFAKQAQKFFAFREAVRESICS